MMLVLYRPNTPSLALTSYQHAGVMHVMLVRAGNLRPLISLWYPHYDYVLAFHLFLSKHSRHISCQLPSIIYSITCSVTDKAKRFPTNIPSLNQFYTHGEKKSRLSLKIVATQNCHLLHTGRYRNVPSPFCPQLK